VAQDLYAELVEVPENVADRFVFAAWSELDLGLQATAGVDMSLGRRVFPFVEYRQLFGKLEIDEIRVGLAVVPPEKLATLDGTPIRRKYDWSGPNLMVGLKIRF